MTAAFFLMLREGLEAALIVGIIAAYLVRIGRRDALPRIAVGVGAAIGLSVAAGLIVVLSVGHCRSRSARPSRAWPSVDRGRGADLDVVLDAPAGSGHQRRAGAWRGRGPDRGVHDGARRTRLRGRHPRGPGDGALSVRDRRVERARWGRCSWRRRQASLSRSGSAGRSSRSACGSICRRFFTGTGIVLIFVSAGLVAYGIAEFTEVGLLPVTPTAFDLSGSLPVSSPIGSMLAGLFGYRAAPTVLELLGYLAYLIPVMVLFLGVPRRARPVASGVARDARAPRRWSSRRAARRPPPTGRSHPRPRRSRSRPTSTRSRRPRWRRPPGRSPSMSRMPGTRSTSSRSSRVSRWWTRWRASSQASTGRWSSPWSPATTRSRASSRATIRWG